MVQPLIQAFTCIPDPRRPQGRRHSLPAILTLMSVATMCGCRSLYAIVQWGRDHGADMAVKLGFNPRHGVPAVSTLHELLKRLDGSAFESALHRLGAAGG